MSYHDFIRNQWVTQMLTDAEYIKHLEEELRDKKHIDPEEYDQTWREVDLSNDRITCYEEEIFYLQKEVNFLERQNSDLIDEIDNLSSEISMIRDRYE